MASRAAAFHHGLLGRRDLRRHLKHHLARPRVHILHLHKRGAMRPQAMYVDVGKRLRTSPSSSNWMAQCVPGTSCRSSPSAPAAGSGSGGGSSTAGNTPALRSACSCKRPASTAQRSNAEMIWSWRGKLRTANGEMCSMKLRDTECDVHSCTQPATHSVSTRRLASIKHRGAHPAEELQHTLEEDELLWQCRERCQRQLLPLDLLLRRLDPLLHPTRAMLSNSNKPNPQTRGHTSEQSNNRTEVTPEVSKVNRGICAPSPCRWKC